MTNTTTITKGIYYENPNLSLEEKLKLKGELRSRAAELNRQSDEAQRKAAQDIAYLRLHDPNYYKISN